MDKRVSGEGFAGRDERLGAWIKGFREGNTNMPEKIFMGIDASGWRGFKTGHESMNYFTIVAVSCTEFQDAEEAVERLAGIRPDPKGENLHSSWKVALRILTDYHFRYYALLFDKKSTSADFQNNFRKLEFPGTVPGDGYTAINDQYSKHGWLAMHTLKLYGHKGHTEVRVDVDLKGPAWELYKKKVKEHAETMGSCDFKEAGMEYPLVRIADIVSNFCHWHMKDRMYMEGDPEAVYILKPQMLTLRLVVEPDFVMFAENNPVFLPWEGRLF